MGLFILACLILGVSISISLKLNAQPGVTPLPSNTSYLSTSNATGYKKAAKACTSSPLKLVVSGVAHQADGSFTVGNFSISFGSGSGTQYAYDCSSGGTLVTCQVINCQGQTFLTMINTLP